ncbi:Maf family protein [Vibrio hippocampi]|uniref:7-methyl-GTP pyrophosphatase n=1 Tax=Vibrio hippocampi TaxID=654686 RepID=A0ABM8ZI78_9VIBR|nr:Maf family protein [Vibrio hippocampi]CAH0526541.1 7-methyl-GTP pyrophosphatase [Vibrio hippocampi]
MPENRLILASTSPYRAEILSKLQLPFETMAPETDETELAKETAPELVVRLAKLKAEALTHIENGLIIGSDQVCVIDGKIIGKPLTREKAIEQLLSQSGKTIRFYTGLALHNTTTGITETRLDTFDVTFRTLSNDQIEAYVDIEQPYYCAGSFKSEGLGIALFSDLAGKDPNTLIGLPLIDLIELLEQQGISPLTK